MIALKKKTAYFQKGNFQTFQNLPFFQTFRTSEHPSLWWQNVMMHFASPGAPVGCIVSKPLLTGRYAAYHMLGEFTMTYMETNWKKQWKHVAT